jgi:3-isopropylmalate/(R)-2-methylmalate dehydratase large subunit
MRQIQLSPLKRVLYLTKDPELLKKQLYDGLCLRMQDLHADDLLDDINTDAMTPAWVCFNYKPHDIAVHAYAGLLHQGEQVFKERALMDGNFEVIVSGSRKGTGSSRETAAQCERFCGIRIVIAASFAPIHERNNINLGQLMGDYDILKRLESGESVDLGVFTEKYDAVTRQIVESGGLFQFSRKIVNGDIKSPEINHVKRSMNMTEKILAQKAIRGSSDSVYVKPGDVVFARVDGGYSHEFTSAQVHAFLQEEFGNNYAIKNPDKFAIFEDHLIYAKGVTRMAPFSAKINQLSQIQKEFGRHTGVRDYSAQNGVSPGICHEVAREEFIEPGDFIQATDSHTCMGGGVNALAYGVGATEYAALIYSGMTIVCVPGAIRFELVGTLPVSCTAKDVMLYILSTFAKREETLNLSMEFGGSGLLSMSLDERATLCNMATECTARTGICEPDESLLKFIRSQRVDVDIEKMRKKMVFPDANAVYVGGIHQIDLSKIKPMVAHPGNPDQGIPSDPTNGALVADLGDVAIDIAYAGSCTAGKFDDMEFYAMVARRALAAGKKVHPNVKFYIQFGSNAVAKWAKAQGLTNLFAEVGAVVLDPGCGACIGCGPGVSENKTQVTVSAINRNFQGRSGPGKLYLASPLTVAASAFAGKIVAYETQGSNL